MRRDAAPEEEREQGGAGVGGGASCKGERRDALRRREATNPEKNTRPRENNGKYSYYGGWILSQRGRETRSTRCVSRCDGNNTENEMILLCARVDLVRTRDRSSALLKNSVTKKYGKSTVNSLTSSEDVLTHVSHVYLSTFDWASSLFPFKLCISFTNIKLIEHFI